MQNRLSVLFGGVLLLRTRLLSLTGNVDLDRLHLDGLLLLSIALLHEAHGDLLLAHADDGGNTPEQKNASRGAPADPQHEQAHDASHDHGLVTLRVILLAHLHQNHGQERSAGEHDHEDEVRKERAEAASNRTGRRHNQVGNQIEELIALVGTQVVGHLAKHLEQSNKDRHLEQHRKTTSERVELHLRVYLLHLLGLTRGIIGETIFQGLNLRLHLLHSIIGLRLLMHEGRDNDTKDNRDDDDRQSPVVAEVIEELDDVEDPVFKDIPHSLPFQMHQRLRERDRTHTDRQGGIAVFSLQ